METLNVTIICNDPDYASALAWAIVRNTKGMEVWVCTDKSSIMQEGAVPDVILTDMDHSEKKRDSVVISLTEKRADEDVRARSLFKYKNIREMVNDIYSIYGEVKGISDISDTESRKDIYCFISERGGSGCTSVCNAFADEMTRVKGSRVLKLSLEQFPDHSDSGSGNIKKYLYHVLKDKEMAPSGSADSPKKDSKDTRRDGMVTVRAFVTRDENGVDSFRQPMGQNPLLQLEENEFASFMKCLAGDSTHDVIVIDCGSQITMQMIKSMQLSKRIFFVKDDRSEKTGWRNCMGMITEKRVIDRIVPAVNTNGRAVSRAAELVEQFA